MKLSLSKLAPLLIGLWAAGIDASSSSETMGTTTTTTTSVSRSSSSSSSISPGPSPGPGNCTSYTASCSDLIKRIMSTNSIVSPQLVDYRMQTAILGITNQTALLAKLGPNPCQKYTNSTENKTCKELMAHPQFVGELLSIGQRVMKSLQTCASDYARGVPDYHIIITDPYCTTNTSSTFSIGGQHDLTRNMLEAIDISSITWPVSPSGQPKSASLQLTRRDQASCAKTGQCFRRCPDCRDRETTCGASAAALANGVCAADGVLLGAAVSAVAGGACGFMCGPGAPVCAVFCANAMGGMVGVAWTAACLETQSAICDPLTERCDNCNSANEGICDRSSTQCCPGETGHTCGRGCCCCGPCYAPGGLNCECTRADC